MTARWTATPALYRAIAVVVLGVGIGIFVGRADLVALAAPVALVTLLALVGRPARSHRMVGTEAAAAVGGEIVSGSTVGVRVELTGLTHTELATVKLPENTAHPTGMSRTVAGGADTELDVRIDSRHWGRMLVARPDLMVVGPDALFWAGPMVGEEVEELVLPAVPKIAPLQLPPISGGWAGAHVSRRPGQGSDLVDLREYAPGDRMRSVHWRAFARLGKLYTRRTLSDADADLTLCLDVRHNIGPRVQYPPLGALGKLAQTAKDNIQEWRDDRSERHGGPGARDRLDQLDRARYTSLDHTVHAAAAIASAQLGCGDRIGVMLVNATRKSLRPGTGTRHLQRIRYFLSTLSSSSRRIIGVPYWGLRPGAVVVLLTPLVDDQAADAAIECAGRGHQTVVVDTLPMQGILKAATGADVAGLQILSVERSLRLDRVRQAGIPVLNWDAGQIDLELAIVLKTLRARR